MPEAAVKPKTPAEQLADAIVQTEVIRKQAINETVDAVLADKKFETVPKDIMAMVKREMRSVANLDDNSQLVLGKKQRTPEAWIEKNFPSILVQAEKPRGDVEMQAAVEACGSLAMQANLVKAVGSQRASELMALVGGKIGSLTKPLPIKDDAKPGRVPTGDNPWSPPPKWNITKQGSVVKAMGVERANEIAAAVGSFVGATRPNLQFGK